MLFGLFLPKRCLVLMALVVNSTWLLLQGKIIPLMVRMVNDSMKNDQLPGSLYEANNCLLLKRGKEEIEPTRGRPIALLHCDHKILTKVLAKRLGKHISKIIHPNQTGFIPGRFSFSNVHLLLNMLYSVHDKNMEVAILSLDAEKAFDQVELPYMFQKLQ